MLVLQGFISENILLLLLLALIGAWYAFIVAGEKALIRRALKEEKARFITIRWLPFDFKEKTNTYRVTYEDHWAREHSRKCFIKRWSSVIYWLDEG